MIMSVKPAYTTSNLWRGLFAALLLIGLGGVWIVLREEPSRTLPSESSAESPTQFQPYVLEVGTIENEGRGPLPTSTRVAREVPREASASEERILDELMALESRDEADEADEMDETGERLLEEREELPGNEGVWEDPVNREVLGPPSWMAEPSEEESARIQAVFDEAERLRAENEDTFVLDDRHRAIELARDAVEDCFDALLEFEPEAIGRVIIAFEIRAAAGTATLEQGRITTNVGLHDLDFIACVETGLAQITFGAVGEGGHSVEYPVFFDQ